MCAQTYLYNFEFIKLSAPFLKKELNYYPNCLIQRMYCCFIIRDFYK